MIRHHKADWFRVPDSKGRGGVLRMKEKFAIRGLSCKIGETLAHWLLQSQHREVAEVLIAAQFQ